MPLATTGPTKHIDGSTKAGVDIVASERAAIRTIDRCRQLARCSDRSDMLVRLFCSPAMNDAHALLRTWMAAAGMTVRSGDAANLIGRWSPIPSQGNRRALLIGSHIDTVINAGAFDGPLGVMVGIEIVELLRSSCRALPFDIEVIAFSEEEGVRFQTPYIGSLALIGELSDQVLDRRDANGESVAEALRKFGCTPSRASSGVGDPNEVIGYLEPHIEQGPVLESRDLPTGIVTGIFGQTRATLCIAGQAAHAGTTPMHCRRDALAAAAEIILATELLGQRLAIPLQGATDATGVATVGYVEVDPNVGNVVPGQVRLRLDLRHLDDAARQSAFREFSSTVATICIRRNVQMRIERVDEQGAVRCAPMFVHAIEEATRAEGIAPWPMPSGAGHDAAILARRMPVGMVFVRCKDGVSHHPNEAVDVADVAALLRVLFRTVLAIACRESSSNP